MPLLDQLRALRRWWLPALAALLLVFFATLVVGTAQPTRYGSTATLLFAVSGGDSATDLNQASTYLQREMTSYARVAKSPLVLDPVVKSLRLNETAADLAHNVAAVNPTNSVLLDITVTHSDPQPAASIANAVANSLARVAESTAPMSSGQQLLKVTMLSPAQPPGAPAGISINALAALGVSLGIAAAALVLIAAARWDRRVWRAIDVDREMTGPVMASLPHTTGDGATQQTVVRLHRAADELLTQGDGRAAALIAVTAPAQGAGQGLVASALGQAIAEIGGRAAVVDLSTASSYDARSFLQRLVVDGSTGPTLAGVKIRQFAAGRNLTEVSDTDPALVRAQVDVMLFDTPDLYTSSAAATLMSVADGAVLVVPAGSRNRAVQSAVDRLANASGRQTIRPVQVVLTRVAVRDACSL